MISFRRRPSFLIYFLTGFVLHLFIFSVSNAYASTPYSLRFKGVKDKALLNLIKEVSNLKNLEKQPPTTLTALRRRADGDLPNMLKVLHSFAYYNAKIDVEINNAEESTKVTVWIETGDSYPIKTFQVIEYEGDSINLSAARASIPNSPPFEGMVIEDLGIEVGEDAKAKTIIDAENTLFYLLSQRGYPLARLNRKEILVDQLEKNVSIFFIVETGLRLKFGPTTVTGLDKVSEKFVHKNLRWKEGSWYNPKKVEYTRLALEQRRVFSNVEISFLKEPIDEQFLQMKIDAIESLHRSVGGGLSYTTQKGPGLLFEWEHRNLEHKGKQLGFRGEIWNKAQNLSLVYRQPHFITRKQDLVWIGEYDREDTKAFDEFSYSGSVILERKMNEWNYLSFGVLAQRVFSSKTNSEANYSLIKTPITYKFSTVDNILNPTRGRNLLIKATPAGRFINFKDPYVILEAIGSVFVPIPGSIDTVLASKLVVGSIVGPTTIFNIPKKDRFYSGSESSLRGYEYYTVSPISTTGELIGGKSICVLSIEPRYKINEQHGFVLFYEIGNVYTSTFPDLDSKQLMSSGFGWRYFTPIGPLRFDVAFPMNRRPSQDKHRVQFYFSIGQTF